MVNYQMPVNIVISEGAIASTLANSTEKYFIISGNNSHRDILTLLKQHIDIAGNFSGIGINPTEEEINKIVNAMCQVEFDTVISIGGGSIHDAAKASLLAYTMDEPIEALTVDRPGAIQRITALNKKLITIPTICGTGAEISPAALVTIKSHKKILFSRNLYPTQTLIDLNYVFKGASADLVVQVGFDSLVQGIEAYTAKNSNSFSDSYALAAIKLTSKCLYDLSRSTNDKKLREELAVAALLSIMGVSISGVGGIHAIADPLSGRQNIHHGTALAMVAPGVIKLNYQFCQKRYDEIATIIASHNGLDDGPLDVVIAQYVDKLQIRTAKNILINDSDNIDAYVADTNNPDMQQNPREFKYDEIYNIFKSL